MPTALQVAAQVAVDATPEQVWRAVVDWPRQHEWIWATRVRGGHGIGAEVTGWTGIGPVGFTDPMVITEWDPPRRCTVRHTGRIVRGTGVFEVAARGSQSEFRWAEHLQLPMPPAIGRPVGLMVRPLAQWGLRSSLRRFARLLPPS
jgi:carbon monoxide dehydrogenase subunit G